MRGSAIFLVLLQKRTTLEIVNDIGAGAALTVFSAIEVGGAYDVLSEADYCEKVQILSAIREMWTNVHFALQIFAMPAEGQNKLTFHNWKNTQRLPFVIYADFESSSR